MRKVVSLLLIALLVVSFSYCGLSAAKPEKITVWLWKAAKDPVDARMSEFKKAYPNIDVNFEVAATGEVLQKLTLAFSSGGSGSPDVSLIETDSLGKVLYLNSLTELGSLVNKSKYSPATISATSLKGKIYASTWDIGPQGIFYRRDIFEAAGLPSDPEKVQKLLATWDDYYKTAKIIKAKTGKTMLPFSLKVGGDDVRFLSKIINQRGVTYFDAKEKLAFNRPETIEAFKYIKRMVKEGLTSDVEAWSPTWVKALDDGEIATLPIAVWIDGLLKHWISPEKGKGKWAVVPLPVWEKGNPATANWGGSSWIIPKYTKHMAAAKAFVKFFTNKDSMVAMFASSGIFPATNDVVGAPIFNENDPYYGGQNINKLFADLAGKLPKTYPTRYYDLASTKLGEELQQYIFDKKEADDAVKSAADSVNDAR